MQPIYRLILLVLFFLASLLAVSFIFAPREEAPDVVKEIEIPLCGMKNRMPDFIYHTFL
jgi:hypothetical protein